MRRLHSAALSTLRFFDVAARLLSFTRAAEELQVTQGAVSQHIKALEDRLGCKLFLRLPGQIKLTDDGQRFAEAVTRALQELEAAAEMLAKPGKSGVNVRIRVSSSFALRWLIPRLERLRARHPHIKPHLVGDEHHLDPARRGFDLAIELAQAPPSGLRAEPFMDEYLSPVCSPDYLSRHPFLQKPADLARATLLHDGRAWQSASEDAEWRYWLNHTGATAVDSSGGQFFTSANMAIEAALAHQGVALGRLLLLETPLATRTLVAPFSQRITSPARYYLAYPRDPADRHAVNDLASWLRDEAQAASVACLRTSGSSVGINGYDNASTNVYSLSNSRRPISRVRAASIRVTAN
jgi:LysR family glycine cleavage system transcriptional activator